MRLESNNLQRSFNDSQLAMRERDRLQGIVNELQVRMRNNHSLRSKSLQFK